MKNILSILVFASLAFGQGRPTYNIDVKYRIDAGSAVVTRPNRTGAGSPAGRDACTTVGETYFQSDAAAGKNLFFCTTAGAADTAVWTPQSRTRTITAAFTGGGSALSAGSTAPLYAQCTTMAAAGTFLRWTILVDTGTATFKLWKNSSASALPTVSNSISSSGFTISSGTKATSTTLTDLSSAAFNAGDNICVQLSGVSGSVTDAKLILEYF